jgi:hypothetical protein
MHCFGTEADNVIGQRYRAVRRYLPTLHTALTMALCNLRFMRSNYSAIPDPAILASVTRNTQLYSNCRTPLINTMSQSNLASSLIQDMEFVDNQDQTVVVGGLSIARWPGHGGWENWHPKPIRPIHPIRPVHPPIFELPKPHPRPFPLPHPIIIEHGPVMTTH